MLENYRLLLKDIKVRRWIKTIAITIGVTIIVIICSIIIRALTAVDWKINNLVDNRQTDEFNTDKPWDEMRVYEKYSVFQYGENTYISIGSITDYIDVKIGNIILTGNDAVAQKKYKTSIDIYSIDGLQIDDAVAVKFNDDTSFYVYLNMGKQTETLGDFLKKFDLREAMDFKAIWYEYYKEGDKRVTVQYTGFESDIIWEMLFDDETVKCVENSDIDNYVNTMTISTFVNNIGYENLAIGITTDGYLTVSSFDTYEAFFIGKQKTRLFFDYVIKNFHGNEIVYEETKQSQ